ncbi:DUF3486 family protein [Geomonas sp. Red32]|uniref:DUF3486 family protein n=1 Tax=Geomonas sp. Red32 TaxID=2912856 RepID=UPI00202CF93E|nr:DUF3486 family protein [Geomonas sp. Red32]MCM0081791.1 DUF3486 family protein [Geomonas sp. Red32]
MPKPSTIEQLPPDIKNRLQELLQDPRVSQLELTAHINELLEAGGHDERVSKSAVNRYALRMADVGEKLRQSRDVADMFISKVGAAPQGQMGLLINEILRTLAFDLTLKIQDADLSDPETLASTIDQVKALALATQRLEQGAMINIKRESEIRRQALEDAAKRAAEVAKKGGISADTISSIRREILGISA